MSILDTMTGGTVPAPLSAPRVRPNGHDKGEVDVIPYRSTFDPEADKFLPWFWRRLKDDGVLDLYFPGEPNSFGLFSNLMSDPTLCILLFVVRDDAKLVKDAIGFASWAPLNLGGKLVGNAGFLFLKDYWDRHTTIAACRRGMKFWFTEMDNKLDMAIGINATGNRLTQMFLNRLQWTRMGTIPIPQFYKGESSDTAIWYITRDQFLKQEEAK